MRILFVGDVVGRTGRTAVSEYLPGMIRDWALEHDLPYFDDEVHFPDLRIEYELDGRSDHVDVEVITQHYRGAHAASVARSSGARAKDEDCSTRTTRSFEASQN